jgi:hypothetical protein
MRFRAPERFQVHGAPRAARRPRVNNRRRNRPPGRQALSSGGRPRLDYASVAQLAFPFMLNSAVQAVLNASDTWRSRFRSHLTVRLRWHALLVRPEQMNPLYAR